VDRTGHDRPDQPYRVSRLFTPGYRQDIIQIAETVLRTLALCFRRLTVPIATLPGRLKRPPCSTPARRQGTRLLVPVESGFTRWRWIAALVACKCHSQVSLAAFPGPADPSRVPQYSMRSKRRGSAGLRLGPNHNKLGLSVAYGLSGGFGLPVCPWNRTGASLTSWGATLHLNRQVEEQPD
jgi:hypothetical protein